MRYLFKPADLTLLFEKHTHTKLIIRAKQGCAYQTQQHEYVMLYTCSELFRVAPHPMPFADGYVLRKKNAECSARDEELAP